MKLGRDELERSVAQFRMPEPAMDRLVALRRRRSRRDRATAAIVAIAVLALALATLGRSFMTTQPGTRNDHPAPPWRTADVDGITFTNPGGWHLTGYFDGTAKLAAIGSFSPNLSGSDPCDGMPNDGAILVIDPLAGGRAPAWPTDLADGSIASEASCGAEHLGARWSANGRTYQAVASFGDAVSPATRDALMRAFSSLSFAGAANAISSSSCFVKDGYPAILGEVIAGDTTSDLPWTVYQLGAGSGCLPDGGVELVTADPGYQFATLPPAIAGGSSLDVHDGKVGEGSYVAGIVGIDVSAMELTLADGSRERAALAPLAPFFPDWQVYFAPIKAFQQGVITALAADGSPMLRAGFRLGMDCTDGGACGVGVSPGETIAEGSDASSPYRLLELDGNVELQDAAGSTVASVPVSSDRLTVRVARTGDQRSVAFGVAPSETAIVVQQLPWPEGWDLTQWARLRDGTVVFWSQTYPGELGVSPIAAFDGRCNPLSAIDSKSAPVPPPDRSACVGATGSGPVS